MCLANVCQGPKDKSGWEKPSNTLLHQLLSNFLSGKGHKSCKKFVFAFLIGDTGTPLHPMKTNRPSLKINLKVCSKKKKRILRAFLPLFYLHQGKICWYTWSAEVLSYCSHCHCLYSLFSIPQTDVDVSSTWHTSPEQRIMVLRMLPISMW